MIVACPECGEEIDVASVSIALGEWTVVDRPEWPYACRCDEALHDEGLKGGNYKPWDEWYEEVFVAILERLDEITIELEGEE
jgi:hypothetical protein